MLRYFVDKATEAFLKNLNIGNNPALKTRMPDCPVGLKVRHFTILPIAQPEKFQEPWCNLLC
jgi:hypothetical protein